MYQRIISTDSAQKLPIPQDAWMLYQFSDLEIVRLDLSAGEGMPPHENPWRIVFYLLSGSGSLDVEGSVRHLGSGESIAVEAGKVRSWTNTGEGLLELLVIKTNLKSGPTS